MFWDLTYLYPSFASEEFARDLTLADEKIAFAEETALSFTGRKDGAKAAWEFISRLSDAYTVLSRLSLYIELTLACDASQENALAQRDKILLFSLRMEKLSSAFSRFIAPFDVESLIAEEKELEPYRYLILNAQQDAQHALDSSIEDAVLTMQMTGGTAFEQLYQQATSSLVIPFEKDGGIVNMPLSQIRGLAYSPDAETRRKAYEAELASYPSVEIPVAASLNGIKGEALSLCRFKKYDDVIDMALDTAHMDRETLDALIAALKESLPAFRRFFRAKAKLLGYEGGLKFYDLFAPVGKSGKTYTIEEARQTLVDILGRFSKKMADHIDFFFEKKLIDVYPRAGKEGGAFCAPAHAVGLSYVLTNFDGSLSSVSTIAHELGHAYHNSCLMDKPILLSDYPMPLAETASIFNETLLVENMLASADRDTRLQLLDQQLTDDAQVVVDILSRFLFESEVVRKRKERTLSAKELCSIMLAAQKETYGDGLDSECLHPYMWACKSHYYSTGVHFYNFPYAFGLLFGLGVYARYREKGDAFLPEYDALLASTGNGSVRQVAAASGIDVADINFWRGSLSVILRKIDEFEALANA